jgi:hypothetical protein
MSTPETIPISDSTTELKLMESSLQLPSMLKFRDVKSQKINDRANLIKSTAGPGHGQRIMGGNFFLKAL